MSVAQIKLLLENNELTLLRMLLYEARGQAALFHSHRVPLINSLLNKVNENYTPDVAEQNAMFKRILQKS